MPDNNALNNLQNTAQLDLSIPIEIVYRILKLERNLVFSVIGDKTPTIRGLQGLLEKNSKKES